MGRGDEEASASVDYFSMLSPLLLFAGGNNGNRHISFELILLTLLPLLLKALPAFLKNAWTKYASRDARYVTRTIAVTRSSSWWLTSDENTANVPIQKAILAYINKFMPERAIAWRQADVQARKKPLPAADANTTSSKGTARGGRDNDDDDGSGGTVEQYGFQCSPPEGEWVDLVGGVQLMRSVKTTGDKVREVTTYFELRAPTAARITRFIDEALGVYNAELASKLDTSRYLYVPTVTAAQQAAASSEDGGKASTKPALYKRYKLGEERTFASLFLPEKDAVLSLVEAFTHKTGKFAIPGYPQKLGFLLHGPPGTGKTSFIKALAHHTRRHIISIPLAKIRTNQELFDLMMDLRLQIAGTEDEKAPTSLAFERVIFVMEDVDAASTVVHRRDSSAPPPDRPSVAMAAALVAAKAAAAEARAAAKAGGPGGKSGASSGHGEIEVEEEGEEGEEEETGKAGAAGSGAGGGAATSTATGTSTTQGTASAAGPVASKYLKDWLLQEDALNLSGLLNCLDGVVDTPNRIVVMTTNHPEKLDPALVRPGRINRQIYLGRMRQAQAAQMMRHYFSAGAALEPEGVEARLAACFVDEVLSPAEMEAMCAEFDTATEMVAALEARFGGGGTGGAGAAVAAGTTADGVAGVAADAAARAAASTAPAAGDDAAAAAAAPAPVAGSAAAGGPATAAAAPVLPASAVPIAAVAPPPRLPIALGSARRSASCSLPLCPSSVSAAAC